MDRTQDWPELLLKFANTISKDNLIDNTNKNDNDDAEVSNSNEVVATHSGIKVNRYISVLNNLLSCKNATTTLINIQLTVISLHRLLNQVNL